MHQMQPALPPMRSQPQAGQLLLQAELRILAGETRRQPVPRLLVGLKDFEVCTVRLRYGLPESVSVSWLHESARASAKP